MIINSFSNIKEEIKANDVNSESATEGQVLTADGQGGSNWQDGGSGGSSVIPNPFLYGNETLLEGLQIDGNKYRAPKIEANESGWNTSYWLHKININGTRYNVSNCRVIDRIPSGTMQAARVLYGNDNLDEHYYYGILNYTYLLFSQKQQIILNTDLEPGTWQISWNADDLNYFLNEIVLNELRIYWNEEGIVMPISITIPLIRPIIDSSNNRFYQNLLSIKISDFSATEGSNIVSAGIYIDFMNNPIYSGSVYFINDQGLLTLDSQITIDSAQTTPTFYSLDDLANMQVSTIDYIMCWGNSLVTNSEQQKFVRGISNLEVYIGGYKIGDPAGSGSGSGDGNSEEYYG